RRRGDARGHPPRPQRGRARRGGRAVPAPGGPGRAYATGRRGEGREGRERRAVLGVSEPVVAPVPAAVGGRDLGSLDDLHPAHAAPPPARATDAVSAGGEPVNSEAN